MPSPKKPSTFSSEIPDLSHHHDPVIRGDYLAKIEKRKCAIERVAIYREDHGLDQDWEDDILEHLGLRFRGEED